MKQILTLITCLLFTGLAYGQKSEDKPLYIYATSKNFAFFKLVKSQLTLFINESIDANDVIISIRESETEKSIFTGTASVINLPDGGCALNIDYPAVINTNNIDFAELSKTLVLRVNDGKKNNVKTILFDSNVFMSFLYKYSKNEVIYFIN